MQASKIGTEEDQGWTPGRNDRHQSSVAIADDDGAVRPNRERMVLRDARTMD